MSFNSICNEKRYEETLKRLYLSTVFSLAIKHENNYKSDNKMSSLEKSGIQHLRGLGVSVIVSSIVTHRFDGSQGHLWHEIKFNTFLLLLTGFSLIKALILMPNFWVNILWVVKSHWLMIYDIPVS